MSAVLVCAAAAIAAGVVAMPAVQKYRRGERFRTADKVRVAAAVVIVLAACTWAVYRARPGPASSQEARLVGPPKVAGHPRPAGAAGPAARFPGGAPYVRPVSVDVPEPPPTERMYGGYRPFDDGVVSDLPDLTPDMQTAAAALGPSAPEPVVAPELVVAPTPEPTAAPVPDTVLPAPAVPDPVLPAPAPEPVLTGGEATVTVDGDSLVLEGFEL